MVCSSLLDARGSLITRPFVCKISNAGVDGDLNENKFKLFVLCQLIGFQVNSNINQ